MTLQAHTAQQKALYKAEQVNLKKRPVLLSQAPTEDADLEALDLFFCPMTELGSYWKENLDAVPFSHFVVELSSEETDLPSLLQSFITKQQELRPQWPFLVLLLGHADIALQLFKLVFQIVGDDDFIPSESVRVIRVFPLSDNSTEEAPLFAKVLMLIAYGPQYYAFADLLESGSCGLYCGKRDCTRSAIQAKDKEGSAWRARAAISKDVCDV